MARISKPGLDYFPLDVNFLQDRKVRRISCRHHAAGIAALTSLLCLIYKEKGYYILWNKDTLFDIYNPQIQISAESGTKRSIFRQKNKTKRSKNRLHTTLIKPEQKVNEDLCSGFVLS